MEPIEWINGKIRIIDQSQLPHRETYCELSTYEEVAEAIKTLRIRGAPLIGITAAYGLALGAHNIQAKTKAKFLTELRQIAQALISTRPTAVNLHWAIARMTQSAEAESDVNTIKTVLTEEAKTIHAEEREATHRLSQFGADLIREDFTILTHCNAGSLATGGYGTALGVVKAARQQGKNISVIATETRPLLQGARLTTWELKQAGIPVTLITDSMAGYFMSRWKVNCVIVGADRIAANGDTANKIGTYTLAVLAMENNIPFYVAAPLSTIDLSLPFGDRIPIEHRRPEEVTHIHGIPVATTGIDVANPAFDITPQQYISAIITEEGIVRKPYQSNLAKLLNNQVARKQRRP